jgi:Family of unknown function (DUF6010)
MCRPRVCRVSLTPMCTQGDVGVKYRSNMPSHSPPSLHAVDLIAPIVVSLVFILACSLFREPNRRNFNAIMIGGAGAAYLNGGLGGWEFAFCAVITYCAYQGLHSYRYIGAGWILHTIWDVVHHFYGTPIVPFAPTSSAGCAICDVGIALWCFAGAPSLYSRRLWPRFSAGRT